MKEKLFLLISSCLLVVIFTLNHIVSPFVDNNLNEPQVMRTELSPVHKIIYSYKYTLVKSRVTDKLLVYEIVGDVDSTSLNNLSTEIYLYYKQQDPTIRLMLLNEDDHEQVLLIMENGRITWDISTYIQEKKKH